MISRRFKIQSLNQIIFDTTNPKLWALPRLNHRLLNIRIKTRREGCKSSKSMTRTMAMAILMARRIKMVVWQDLSRNSNLLNSLHKIHRCINRWMLLKCKMGRNMFPRKEVSMKSLIILTSKGRLLSKSKCSSFQGCNSTLRWLTSHWQVAPRKRKRRRRRM